MYARNSSRNSQAKLIVTVCHDGLLVGIKKLRQLWSAQEQEKPIFLNLFLQISDGFERLSAARRVQWSLLGQQEIDYWLLCRDYPPPPCRWKGGTFVLSLNVKSSHFPYYWFLHDIIKIQTNKLSILLIFYFHEALEQLKTNINRKFSL